MMNKSLLKVVFLGLFLSSCGSFNKVAINSASDLLYKASGSVETESNLEMARLSLPGNLTLIEGLLSESKSNEEILATLTKGYAGYAFAINESDLLIDQWEGKSEVYNKKQALINYTKALNFGIRYLKEKNIDYGDLKSKAGDSSALMHLFDKNLSDKKMDLETMLFTAQALGSMINLQKDNIGLVAELPLVKSMFDWVCMKNPSINYGTCDIFFGTYEAGRPKMLGGNPEKGKEIFERAISKHPHNWLIRVAYIQFYLIPQSDEDEFKKQMEVLKGFSESFSSAQIYSVEKENNEWSREERLRFYQALAMKRYELLEKYKAKLF
jgi:hypothetical protein